MQRFFFHAVASGITICDREGRAVANPSLLYAEALAVARRMCGGNSAGQKMWQGWQIEITDEQGRVLDTVPFDAAAHSR